MVKATRNMAMATWAMVVITLLTQVASLIYLVSAHK